MSACLHLCPSGGRLQDRMSTPDVSCRVHAHRQYAVDCERLLWSRVACQQGQVHGANMAPQFKKASRAVWAKMSGLMRLSYIADCPYVTKVLWLLLKCNLNRHEALQLVAISNFWAGIIEKSSHYPDPPTLTAGRADRYLPWSRKDATQCIQMHSQVCQGCSCSIPVALVGLLDGSHFMSSEKLRMLPHQASEASGAMRGSHSASSAAPGLLGDHLVAREHPTSGGQGMCCSVP